MAVNARVGRRKGLRDNEDYKDNDDSRSTYRSLRFQLRDLKMQGDIPSRFLRKTCWYHGSVRGMNDARKRHWYTQRYTQRNNTSYTMQVHTQQVSEEDVSVPWVRQGYE